MLSVILLVFTLACVLADKITEGGVEKMLSEAWAWWIQTTPEAIPPDDVIPTVEEIRELIKRNHR